MAKLSLIEPCPGRGIAVISADSSVSLITWKAWTWVFIESSAILNNLPNPPWRDNSTTKDDRVIPVYIKTRFISQSLRYRGG